MSENTGLPEVAFSGLEPEILGDPMERMSANLSFFQNLHGFGYQANMTVWIPRRDALLSELKEDTVREAKQFLEAALKALG